MPEAKIGIMQGRLSPDEKNLFQFFPENWQAELNLAKLLKFDSIEWLFDWRDWEKNPILCHPEFIYESNIYHRIKRIKIRSICADYFMKYGFIGKEAAESIRILKQLIESAHIVNIEVIVIPFLEKFAVKNSQEKKKIADNIKIILGLCQVCGVKLAFETELDATELWHFVRMFQSPCVGVCYDLGNVASYGHDSPRDIGYLGDLIFEVHIKDRKKGSSQSVYLGEGNVDFAGCFRALKDIGFNGPMILQAFRGENCLEDAKKQFRFIKDVMEKTQKEGDE